MFIYKIINTINGKVYIGQTKNKVSIRLAKHKSQLNNNKHLNSHLQNAWNKYGETNFKFEILEQFDSEMNFDLDNLERYWIKHYDSMNPEKGYNLESGGSLYKLVSEETRMKISAGKLGNKNPFYGKKHTQESLQLISKSLLGKVDTIETKQKKSQSLTGLRKSEEHKIKLSESAKIRFVGEGNPRARKVIDMATGTVFNCAKAAAVFLKINYNRLIGMLTGRLLNKTTLRYLTTENI